MKSITLSGKGINISESKSQHTPERNKFFKDIEDFVKKHAYYTKNGGTFKENDREDFIQFTIPDPPKEAGINHGDFVTVINISTNLG